MFKVLLFDLQGTLVENGVFPSPIKQAKFILNIRRNFHEFVPLFEKVLMTHKYESLAQAFKAVSDEFELDLPDYVIEKMIGLWNKNKLLSKPYSDTVEILQRLKEKHKLALMANIDCFTKDIITKYELEKYFDIIFLSCDTGLLKTDAGYFDMIMEKLGVEKADILVIGDSMESDMKSAEAAGIRTLLIDRNDRMIYDNKILSLTKLIEYLGD